jgi:hypothetical protein
VAARSIAPCLNLSGEAGPDLCPAGYDHDCSGIADTRSVLGEPSQASDRRVQLVGLEPGVFEREGSAVLGHGAHQTVGGPGGKGGLNLKGHLHRFARPELSVSHQVLDDLLCDNAGIAPQAFGVKPHRAGRLA